MNPPRDLISIKLNESTRIPWLSMSFSLNWLHRPTLWSLNPIIGSEFIGLGSDVVNVQSWTFCWQPIIIIVVERFIYFVVLFYFVLFCRGAGCDRSRYMFKWVMYKRHIIIKRMGSSTSMPTVVLNSRTILLLSHHSYISMTGRHAHPE